MATIKIIPSKTLAKELTKSKENKNGYIVEQAKTYDFWQGEKAILKVIYPFNYFAVPQEYDQNDLNRLMKVFKQTKGENLNDFARIFFENAEI